ncbi:hypothetical protein [Streptomyces sporangiiformans]|uniref:Uncharacterized protein n=1 Tax=Streptomyces sporangiiformans TaxID=2315329 RepID=A0A505DQ00_9ACTN|nr:hypothetical protein [Streptomyces sporangiiformans]TPQ23293.1 hypothetical protein FGD71_005070 [Streptomyces sporangiiformans]
MDRLVAGRPALTATAVGELCEEPTLGQLREALSIEAGHLLVSRPDSFRQRAGEDRQQLGTHHNLRHESLTGRRATPPPDRHRRDPPCSGRCYFTSIFSGSLIAK